MRWALRSWRSRSVGVSPTQTGTQGPAGPVVDRATAPAARTLPAGRATLVLQLPVPAGTALAVSGKLTVRGYTAKGTP